MRIAYLVSEYPAASHTFIRREVEELRARGIDVQTFSVRRPPAREQKSERDRKAAESTFYLLPAKPIRLAFSHAWAVINHPTSYCRVLILALRHRAPGMRALIWAFLHFGESIMLARELSRARIDHVHNHFANAGANIGLIATRFLNLPWSFTLHGVSETDYPAGLLLAAKIEAARFVACVSYFGRAQAMRAASPEQWHKLFIARCGLPSSAFASRRIEAADGPPRLVCVGRLSPEKGQLGLLEALAIMFHRNIAVQLIMVGDGPERGRIERRIQELGLAEHVVLKGQLSEEDTLLEITRAQVLVLPSFMEGLPVVLMEAMAIGVPVVATRVAGIPELVADEEQGLLFRPGDWVDLAEKISRVLLDTPLRTRLRAAAREKVESEFAIGDAVQPLLARFKRA
jgi:colanic acid/amylovoran biosynthesis glycosyltransferase